MSDTLQELARLCLAQAQLLDLAVAGGEHEHAKAAAREMLSVCSKLHQRLGILVEMGREAAWKAAVDRAAARARPEIPGQLTITDAIRAATPNPSPKGSGQPPAKPKPPTRRGPRKPKS